MTRSILAAWLVALGVLGAAPRAAAQACCAGTAAVTPGRLSLHEDALLGFQARGARLFGDFDDRGHYTPAPAGSSELDFEQDLFGALRVLRRAQVALLVPLVETRREARFQSETGGGLGDLNGSFRYDFVLAGESHLVPGLAGLLGVTVPTGKPADSSSRPLATDATGTGTYQATLGLAVEQTFGPWLLNVTGLFTKHFERSAHGVNETLGNQFTALAACAYAFDGGSALAGVVSYQLQGSATINGATAPGTARRLTTLGASGLLPFGNDWRAQANISYNPTLGSFGKNMQPGLALTLGVVRSWG